MYLNIQQTLSLYNVECNKPYYVSLDSTILKKTTKTFRIDFYAFCICISGEMTIEIDKHDHIISKNNFLIAAPATTFNFVCVSKDFKMNLLLFEKNFLLKNLSNPFIIEKMILFQNDTYSLINTNSKVIKNLYHLLIYLKEKSNSKGKFSDEIIRTIIFNLLLEVAEITHQNKQEAIDTTSGISDLYLKFRTLISENILEHKLVQFYAEELNISNKYLIEIVKKSSEKTPHEIIDEFLLKEAYVLLGNTNLSISEIAFKLQFNSVSAFGRFFKKHTDLSPSEYRIKENLIH